MGRVDDTRRVETAGAAEPAGREEVAPEDEVGLTPTDLAELDVLDPDREERPETD